MLVHIWRRLLACRQVDGVVCSIPLGSKNEEIVARCKPYGLRFICGPETDLIRRLKGAAEWYDADAVLRVRGDCLFVNPDAMDDLVDAFITYANARPHAVSNQTVCVPTAVEDVELEAEGTFYPAAIVTFGTIALEGRT